MLQGFGLVAIIEASTGDDYSNGFKFVHRANHLSPVSEENLSARPICPGGHIFLGNFVLPNRIYCPF